MLMFGFPHPLMLISINELKISLSNGVSVFLTIFLLVVAAVNILCTRQVLLNMAPNAKENPTESTAARAC